MMDPTRREVLRVLEELSAAAPEMRLGQLVANLSYIARGPTTESIWDMDDAELLAAARTMLEDLRARRASVA